MLSKKGFTLVELMISIGIIGVLASLVVIAVGPALRSSRDAKRRADLTTIGRYLTQRCYLPDAGAGTYDLKTLADELVAKNPQYAQVMTSVPRDPKTGTDAVAGYGYVVNADGNNCALFANLENDAAEVTIPGISAPTPAGGTGVFHSASAGANGTTRFFQISN